ncbi:MAG: hypothetical protein B6D41_09695 [Chloroflexi bacterium UTCFX4]|nr:MAG: hypothetical protein B6D41_09695 [Chloroflexi bacterium UTCFX4]
MGRFAAFVTRDLFGQGTNVSDFGGIRLLFFSARQRMMEACCIGASDRARAARKFKRGNL